MDANGTRDGTTMDAVPSDGRRGMDARRGGRGPDVVTLYDASGRAVGAWCERTGRAMLECAFYVREDVGTGREEDQR